MPLFTQAIKEALKNELSLMRQTSLDTATPSTKSFVIGYYKKCEDALKQAITTEGFLEGIKTGKVKTAIEAWLESNIKDNQKTIEPEDAISTCVGFGPAAANKLAEIGVFTVNQLKKAIASKVELPINITNVQSIGLKYYNELKTRIPRAVIVKIEKRVNKIDKDAHFVGSYRRGAEDSGDVDIMIVSNKKSFKEKSERIVKEISDEPHILASGDIKCSFVTGCDKFGEPNRFIHVDIFHVDSEYLGPSLLHFTGPASYNISFRKEVHKKLLVTHPNISFKLSQFGLIGAPEDVIADLDYSTERGFVESLGMPYIQPKDRK